MSEHDPGSKRARYSERQSKSLYVLLLAVFFQPVTSRSFFTDDGTLKTILKHGPYQAQRSHS